MHSPGRYGVVDSHLLHSTMTTFIFFLYLRANLLNVIALHVLILCYSSFPSSHQLPALSPVICLVDASMRVYSGGVGNCIGVGATGQRERLPRQLWRHEGHTGGGAPPTYLHMPIRLSLIFDIPLQFSTNGFRIKHINAIANRSTHLPPVTGRQCSVLCNATNTSLRELMPAGAPLNV